MPVVKCPDCEQEGKVPDSFLGRRIKCSKCGGRFLVTGPAAKAAAPAVKDAAPGPKDAVVSVQSKASPSSANTPTFEGIVVEGIEDGSWDSHHLLLRDVPTEPPAEPKAFPAFTVASVGPSAGGKEYKLLTPKDKVFDNKFDLARLEAVLNDYARKGWTVRSMTTAQVAAFSGGMREELLVLLER